MKQGKQTSVEDCKIVDIRRYSDSRGYLSVIEGGQDIPFDIKRVYYLYLVPETSRGEHAHRHLRQLMVATSGSLHVTLDDGRCKKTFVLDRCGGRWILFQEALFAWCLPANLTMLMIIFEITKNS